MLSESYRHKRYALFLMRTFCVAALYFLLWDFTLIRWTLILSVPTIFMYFFSLVGWRYFLERKRQRIREGIS